MALPICALSTPIGRSAIAVIRTSGDNVFLLLEKIFIPSFIKEKSFRSSITKYHKKFIFGNIVESATKNVIDEVGFIPFVSPNSYTGENTVEIHCHGNPIIIEKIISELYSIGFSPASAGEFTKRAFLNDKINISQAEAIAQIIHARNSIELKSALLLKKGALQNKIQSFKENLLDIHTDTVAELDFIDQDIQLISKQDKQIKLKNIIQQVEILIENTNQVELYSRGFSAVILGTVNVGKSSLLNLLLGYNRSIVSTKEGTTRDYIQEQIIIENHLFKIIDTAGIRLGTKDKIEKEGIIIARKKLQETDVVILLLDTSIPLEKSISSSPLRFLFSRNVDRNFKIIIVCNKVDMIHSSWKPISNKDYTTLFQCLQNLELLEFELAKKIFQNCIFISVKNNHNIGIFQKKLVECINDKTPKIDGIILSAWQKEIFHKLKLALQSVYSKTHSNEYLEIIVAELDYTLELLGMLMGTISNDEILGKIFSKFCIGK